MVVTEFLWNNMFQGLGLDLGLVLGLVILGTLSLYYLAHSIILLTVRHRNHSQIIILNYQ